MLECKLFLALSKIDAASDARNQRLVLRVIPTKPNPQSLLDQIRIRAKIDCPKRH
jgi:hypothetical protein